MKGMVKDIEKLAYAVRCNILEMTYGAGVNGGHIGGALSCADILATLYGEVLNISKENVTNESRDRFLLSKGHVALAHYAVLIERGLMSREHMLQFEISGSDYSTHEVMNVENGIEISSGSLGYGFSIGVGCALNAKIKDLGYRTFVLLGDGECNEGSVWEACMSAARFKLNNLTAIIDVNSQSLDGFTSSIMPVADFKGAFTGMGCHVIEVNGHDIEQLYAAFMTCSSEGPTIVIANTVKGKGIRSIEGKSGWHHARLTEEQYQLFKSELEAYYHG